MHCPKCKNTETKVLDSRTTRENRAVRRRRQCNKCSYRFSTIEEVKVLDQYVEKRSGRVIPFDESKIEQGVKKSFNKRTINEEKIQRIVQEVVERVLSEDENPIKSKKIGKIVLKTLQKRDEAAYICFWSMYGNFDSAEDFNRLLSKFDEEE